MPHALLFALLLTTLLVVPSGQSAAADTPRIALLLTTRDELMAAAARAVAGDVLQLGAGRFELAAPLVIPGGVVLQGAGIDRTTLTHGEGWKASPATLPDPETNPRSFDRSGYLIHLADKAAGIRISNLTLTGPRMHGAIFGSGNRDLVLHSLRIEDFLNAGIRTYSLQRAKIHDCTFVDAGQRWQKGEPGVKGGITGGGIFCIWTQDTEIWNNRFLRTKTAPNEHYYGIKGRQGKRLRIHHNTIEVNFSIEFPFENDEEIEIAHNLLHGTVSIPKSGGGPVPATGRTFHIHHNVFKSTYAIEFVRNGVEIAHNLFDFDPASDGGNLISSFGKTPAKGPASFHNNLVNNPGRGVIWLQEPFANLDVRHNHIRARTTRTQREEGLFGFSHGCDFHTIRIVHNLIECEGTPRPLLRNDASAAAVIENNRLMNIRDTARYENKPTGALAGLERPLAFSCGVNGEVQVDGWRIRPALSGR